MWGPSFSTRGARNPRQRGFFKSPQTPSQPDLPILFPRIFLRARMAGSAGAGPQAASPRPLPVERGRRPRYECDHIHTPPGIPLLLHVSFRIAAAQEFTRTSTSGGWFCSASSARAELMYILAVRRSAHRPRSVVLSRLPSVRKCHVAPPRLRLYGLNRPSRPTLWIKAEKHARNWLGDRFKIASPGWAPLHTFLRS